VGLAVVPTQGIRIVLVSDTAVEQRYYDFGELP